MEKPVSFVECQPASNEISNSIVTRMTSSDEDDDLEIVDTIDETLQTAYKQNKDDLNGETKDADDLRFQLRKDEKRLRELFPHVRSINELDEKELQLAKGVINKEKLMLSKPTPPHPALSGQKRSAENSLLQDSKVQKVNESNKQPVIQSQLSHPETVKPPIKKNPLLGESKVIARPVNFTNNNNNNNNPAKVWHGRENMKYVNGSLINIDNLIQNAPKLPSQNKASISSYSMSSTSSTKMKESEKKLLDEIDLLLSKKSSHEQEANNEWFDNFQNRLQNLEKQEYKDKLRSERSFIIIPGFECINCNHFLTELYPSVCKDKGHVIRSTTLIKRFFLCRGCSRRDSTLSLEKNKIPSSASSTGKPQQPSSFCLPPNHNCAFCGKDDWVLAGKSSSAVGGSGGGDGVHSLTGEKLVTSATDWTSRQDKLNMAVRVSNLDNKR